MDLLPEIVTPPPGPRSRELIARLSHAEAPGLTLPGGVVWAEATGANVVDVDGNRYIDLSAAFGVAGVGHRNQRVVAAVQQQSERLLHGMGDVYAHAARVELVETIACLAPMPDARVFLAGGGAEAVEIALKTATLATGRPGVLAFTGAYHGLTYGALAPTSRAAFRDPFAAQLSTNVVRAPYPYPYRWDGDGDCAAHSLAEAADLLGRNPQVGAVIVEPIQGREGEIVPPEGWLAGLRRLCDEHGVLLIADEIFTGWGRTGRLWAVDHEGVIPDLICVGKGMTGGLPLAACIGRAELMERWRVEGEPLHTATFMGHPLGCVGALAAIAELQERDLIARCATVGAELKARLAELAERSPQIGEVRGRGLMLGLELVRDRASRTPDPELAYQVALAAQARGILLLGGGMYGNVLSITPPFVIAAAQLDYALAVLAEILAA
jgi:4-aminobutyrate aminotransferase/(S)-3-amino-2-methylpropionate transaminase